MKKGDGWKSKKKSSRMDLYSKVEGILASKQKITGFSDSKLPFREFLLRALKELKLKIRNKDLY